MSWLRRARRSPRLVAGLALLAVVAGAAVVAVTAAESPFGLGERPLESPEWRHPLGTDELGRDVLSRVLHGSVTALVVAVPSTALATAIGVAIGLVSGYAGGLVDDVLLKLAELFQVVPRFLLALVTGALFGPRVTILVAVLAVTFWPATARLVRAEVFSLREREFVLAAQALGASRGRVLARHLLPQVLPLVVVTASFQAGAAVLIEGGLAFLGLGDPDAVSWGEMLSDAQSYVHAAWWMAVFPGAAMAVTILAMNLLGDGLEDVLQVTRVPRVDR